MHVDVDRCRTAVGPTHRGDNQMVKEAISNLSYYVFKLLEIFSVYIKSVQFVYMGARAIDQIMDIFFFPGQNVNTKDR